MNSRLDTLLRKQLSYLDYVNVRCCEVCVVAECKKIELRYLILTNSALWSCEYPNPRQLSLLLNLRELRKISTVHDFPSFLTGKYKQNCLHLKFLIQKPTVPSPVPKTMNALPNEACFEISVSPSPKLRKVSLMVTLLKRWRKKTLQHPDVSSDKLSITDSIGSDYLWSEVRNGMISQSTHDNTFASEDSMSASASLPCSIPDSSSSVFEKMVEIEMPLDIYVLKGDSPFYQVVQLTWKSCLLNDLACRSAVIPERNQWQSFWDSQKRLVMNRPEEMDVLLERIILQLQRWPILKFYVWKDVGFIHFMVKSCQRYLSPSQFSLCHGQTTKEEVSAKSQQYAAQVLNFFAECLRAYLVPKIFYDVKNLFHVSLLECCMKAAKWVLSRTSALCCAFEVLHSWQEGQALLICKGNLFAKLSTELQEVFTKLLLEDVLRCDWQYPSSNKQDLIIRNGTLLSVLLENFKTFPLRVSGSYQEHLRLMTLSELNSPLQPFWEQIKQNLLYYIGL